MLTHFDQAGPPRSRQISSARLILRPQRARLWISPEAHQGRGLAEGYLSASAPDLQLRRPVQRDRRCWPGKRWPVTSLDLHTASRGSHSRPRSRGCSAWEPRPAVTWGLADLQPQATARFQRACRAPVCKPELMQVELSCFSSLASSRSAFQERLRASGALGPPNRLRCVQQALSLRSIKTSR